MFRGRDHASGLSREILADDVAMDTAGSGRERRLPRRAQTPSPSQPTPPAAPLPPFGAPACPRRDARPTAENVNILSRCARDAFPLRLTPYPPLYPLYAPTVYRSSRSRRLPLSPLSSTSSSRQSFSLFSFAVSPRWFSSLSLSLSRSLFLSSPRVSRDHPLSIQGRYDNCRHLRIIAHAEIVTDYES